MYFYKTGNSWYAGSTRITIPTGNYSIAKIDDTHCDIVPIQGTTLESFRNVDITTIVKNDANQTYANYAELFAAVEPFFLKASAGGGGTDALTLQGHSASYFEQSGTSQSLVTQLIDGATTHYNTLKKLQDLIIAQNAIIGGSTPDGDNVINTVAELLSVFSTYPEGSDMITMLTAKLNTSDVYNALNSLIGGKALDSRQGKVLKDLIDGLQTSLATKASTADLAAASRQSIINSLIF